MLGRRGGARRSEQKQWLGREGRGVHEMMKIEEAKTKETKRRRLCTCAGPCGGNRWRAASTRLLGAGGRGVEQGREGRKGEREREGGGNTDRERGERVREWEDLALFLRSRLIGWSSA